MENLNGLKCETCKYNTFLSGTRSRVLACGYLLKTGNIRNCKAGEECIRYEKKEK